MHDKLKKILSKKRDLSENEKHAKMDVVKHLRDMASEAMGDKLDGLKKVSVMSNSPQGLKAGLHKASEIVSNPQMDAMKNHAENPYGDYKSALEEHAHDESNQDGSFDADQNRYADGGEVHLDPDKAQDAQDSMRKAFGYNEGGEVESPDMDQSEDGYAAREEADDSEDGSPADQSPEDEGDEDEMGEDEIDEQLEKLMALKKKMSSKKS